MVKVRTDYHNKHAVALTVHTHPYKHNNKSLSLFFGNSLIIKPGWLRIQRSTCLCFLRARINFMCHHIPLNLKFLKSGMRQTQPYKTVIFTLWTNTILLCHQIIRLYCWLLYKFQINKFYYWKKCIKRKKKKLSLKKKTRLADNTHF